MKEQKTLQSSEKALKNTEKKISADLKKGLKQEKEMMRPQRKALWFEKFVYFISSEGYLVLGGKDAQQNEILYKRYLKKGDVYVHADLQGAVPIIIKNKPGMIESPIPPSTLSQAGTLAVATSSAWDSKAVMSAWWVDADKVSKMAPTGDYLTTGSFNIGGNKNYLPPAQLLLGFGIMFKISEQSKIRHFKHRTHESGIIPPKVQIPERVVADEAESVDDAAQSESDVKEPNAQKEIFGRDQAADSHAMDGTQSNSEDSEEDIDSESVHVNPLQPNNCRFSVSQTEHPVSVSSPAESGSRSRASPEGSSEEESEQEIQEQRPIDGNSSTFLEGGPAGTALPSAHTEIIPSASSAQSAKIKYPRVRGKHGKQNKLKSKYANQDEEDRALAMHLLGSAAAQEKAREAAAAKVSKDQEIAAQRERRRRQHAIDTEKGKEAEKIRKIEFDEGVEELDDNELEALGDLDAFVGAPLPGDDILDALVVCGPWDAMGARYRWRVKLQPGSTKKGKAVREILAMWVAAVTDLEKKKRPGSDEGNHTMTEEEKVRTREGELIKAIREPEIIGKTFSSHYFLFRRAQESQDMVSGLSRY